MRQPACVDSPVSVARLAVFVALVLLAGACGKKGPPLAPLHLIPGPATALEVRRTGSEVHLNFVLPAGNVNGGGPSVLDHVKVYAVTLQPGMPAPPNRELLTSNFLVGTMPVKPPPVEGEPQPDDAPPDPRPSAGEKVAFVEPLTPEKLEPARAVAAAGKAAAATAAARGAAGTALLTAALGTVPARNSGAASLNALLAVPAAGPVVFAAAFAAAASEAVTAAIPKHPVRLYVVQGVTKGGRAGQVSARAELPLVPIPAAPSDVVATTQEHAIAITWAAPAESAAAMFNVYQPDGTGPLNPAPLSAPPYEWPGLQWGTEECFTVRAVEKIGTATVESDSSAPACVTPRDTFPPPPPKGLAVVAGPGTISLSWDANGEGDLAGYLVLRGEAPGGTLQPLTPAPIAGTNFEDKTGKPGVRYAYAVVAIDKATPPNQSAPSTQIEETAR